MKNYYDELEISKKASKEVIEKVYKVLAKKYHPDTTKEANKQFAEEKFKAINQAYEILSDNEKRNKYDLELEQSNIMVPYEKYIKVVNERNELISKFRNSAGNNTFTNTSSYVNANYNNIQNANKNNINRNNNSTNNSNLQDNEYYSIDKLGTILSYLKNKVKKFLTTIFMLIISIILSILIINIVTNFNF